MEITPYSALRSTVTGATQFRYFRGREEIGGAEALVMPSWPVRIFGKTLNLCCERDMERTIFPGCSNTIRQEDTMREHVRIIWNGSGDHSLLTPSDKIRAVGHNGVYHFFRGGTLLAIIRLLPGDPDPMGWERRLEMIGMQPLAEDTELLLLSFPLVQIAP